jgi:hypothetical protein
MAEGAVVSRGSVPMHPRLIQCHSGTSKGGDWKSTSRKFLDRRVWKSLDLGVVPGDSTEVWGEIHMNRGRVGEERGGKETDRCPYTTCWFCCPGLEPWFNYDIRNYHYLYCSIMDIDYDDFYSQWRHILQSAALVDTITKSTLSLLSQAFPDCQVPLPHKCSHWWRLV